MPNHLVKVIDSSFNVASLSKNYRVEVIQCKDKEVAYSYEINIDKERTIISCSGRFLPQDCYTNKVTFLDATQASSKYLLLYGIGFGLLLFILNKILNSGK
ncbi:MAG: hypothetical protein QNK89_11105 [Lacinutrix sp.]|uniref:hypothetical protein n=1 Tax=Lacinutrix sp. TaxID=1937692 RepID=UPI0030A5AEE5